MFSFLRKKKPVSTGLGIGLKGGAQHYRAFVGPPHYYDLMSAMTFNLLTCCGLRQEHRLLDIGCGSLRMGRLLIPYLNAQSIFTHSARHHISGWLDELNTHLSDSGALFATFFTADTDYSGDDWIYPDCSRHRPDTIAELAANAGLGFQFLEWAHPRDQVWAVFYKEQFDASLVELPITWNRYIERLPPG